MQNRSTKSAIVLGMFVSVALWLFPIATGSGDVPDPLPSHREKAQLTYAPEVPAPIERNHPAIVEVHIEATRKLMELDGNNYYEFWTFNGHVPGPFVRTRVGDTMEIHFTNKDETGMRHTIDFHASTGPGGGAGALTAGYGETKILRLKLLYPGLYVYHCAVAPVPDHIANGMYGVVLVEPAGGFEKVDHEYYVMQSEFYTSAPEDAKALPADATSGGGTEEPKLLLEYVREDGLREDPRYVVFNGRKGSLVNEPLKAKTGESVRFFFGNIGPNLISSFHLIGEIFDKVYAEADLVSDPRRGIQSTIVPAGGATVVEALLEVPGQYILVDHSIFRIEKGAVGLLVVEGDPRPDVFDVVE